MGGAGAGMGSRGMAGGMAAGAGGRTAPTLLSAVEPAEAKKAELNVRQVGSKTFYRKDNRWVDSEVSDQDERKARVVEQFSDEFFRIARTQSAAQNQYLTFDEAILVKIDGNVYRIDPVKK